MNCTYTVECIYTTVPQTCTICGCINMQMNYLSAGGAVGVVEIDVSQMKWKLHAKFSENSWFPSEIQWYKNTSMGFDFDRAALNQVSSPPANQSNFSRRDLQFVISQIQENNFVVQMSRSL